MNSTLGIIAKSLKKLVKKEEECIMDALKDYWKKDKIPVIDIMSRCARIKRGKVTTYYADNIPFIEMTESVLIMGEEKYSCRFERNYRRLF